MMPTEEQLKLTAIDLYSKFEIETDIHTDYVLLKHVLSTRIRHLIDTNVEQFMQALYRIDVSEQKVKQVLAEKPLDEAIEMIAEMIIERQLQKVITRQKYQQPKGDW